MNEIVLASTTQLATAIWSGDVSASEVLAAHVAQIERHNGALNAIVALDLAQAETRAREADAARARGERWGPLHGVPFTLKDAHATAGVRTTIGSPALDHVPEDDGTPASRKTTRSRPWISPMSTGSWSNWARATTAAMSARCSRSTTWPARNTQQRHRSAYSSRVICR